MGRQLTAQQKKALAAYQDKHKTSQGRTIIDVDDIDADEWYRIDTMHPCEINWQNANRFLQDRVKP